MRDAAATIALVVIRLARVGLAFVSALPPVLWSGLLLLAGLGVAMRLTSRLKAKATARPMTALPAKVIVSANLAGAPDRVAQGPPIPSRGKDVRNPHGRRSHHAAAGSQPWCTSFRRSGAGAHAAHQHHGHSFDGSLVSGVITLSVIVVSLLLALCAAQALARKHPGLMLESPGMATMLLVMQIMH